jgi:glycosyltransferase involved in cell wall biosynthesis
VNIPYQPTGYDAMHATKPSLFAFSHLCSPEYVTGAEKLLLFMIREMQPAYNCTLIVPGEGVIAAKARAAGMQVIVLALPLVWSLYYGKSHPLEELRGKLSDPAWPSLVRLLEARKPDAVLVSTVVHPLPAIAARAFGIPVLWAVMETICETGYTAAAADFIGAHADRIIGLSAAALRPFHRPDLLAKTYVLPPSWHMEELAPAEWEVNRGSLRRQLGVVDGQPLIGYMAASIYENKGFHHYMEMAMRLADLYPAARFLAIGNPADPPYFEQTLNQARSQGRFELIRWIRFEERIERLIPAMDVLVVPSLVPEGFGMVALEGMIFGKAVVSYASGGLAEIHEATGNMAYSVPTGDIDGLTERVGQLIASGQHAEVGLRNRQAAAAAYGIENYRQRLGLLQAQFQPVAGKPVTLVKGGMPTVYLYEGGLLRPFVTERAFLARGCRFEDVRQVPDEWIDVLPKGPPIGRISRAKRRLRGRKRRRKGAPRKLRLRRRKPRMPSRERKRKRGSTVRSGLRRRSSVARGSQPRKGTRSRRRAG